MANSKVLNTELGKLFPIEGLEACSSTRSPVINLLLRKRQLIQEGYPLPFPLNTLSRLKLEAGSSFVPTADVYRPVSAHSKLFAIDCEMCGTLTDSRALIQIAVVDQDYRTIYKTLVMPSEPILEYRTELTGITKNMMRGVQVTLKDVQAKIKEIVAANPDCILMGHGLNHDLNAMGMTHPYVIDTSVMFQVRVNFRVKRPALKTLIQQLGYEIQQGVHSPVEDAIAVMKIVKHVLS